MQLKEMIWRINNSNMSPRRRQYAIHKLRKIAMNPRWRKAFAYNKHAVFATKFHWYGIDNTHPLVNTHAKQLIQFKYWAKVYFSILATLHHPVMFTSDLGPSGVRIHHRNA